MDPLKVWKCLPLFGSPDQIVVAAFPELKLIDHSFHAHHHGCLESICKMNLLHTNNKREHPEFLNYSHADQLHPIMQAAKDSEIAVTGKFTKEEQDKMKTKSKDPNQLGFCGVVDGFVIRLITLSLPGFRAGLFAILLMCGIQMF